MHHLLAGAGGQNLAGLIAALVQVALIDLTLASDNAIAIGMAASGLPTSQRRQAIALGLGGSVALLCVLAFFAVRLLESGGGGLVLGGGVLLLLICFQMWRDLRTRHALENPASAPRARSKTLLRALTQIFIADVSTSLDNVLAVAGAVRDQPTWVLVAGLGLSVALTGFAAAGVARLLHRWPWIGYIGVVVVLLVAGHMIWDGATELGWAPRL